MDVKIAFDWKEILQEEFHKEYFKNLAEFVRNEYAKNKVYPPGSLIFHAFDACPLSAIRVVILGQDPYHGPGQAHGLAFSVNDGVPFPPSLKNIFKEVKDDTGAALPSSGNLDRWAKQGVFLLNAMLTVRAGSPGSHQNKGWEIFTDSVIHKISELKEHVVFLLWGAYAQKKSELIDGSKHYILKAPHPSPFSADRGFFGCKHFSKANDFLVTKGLPKIDW